MTSKQWAGMAGCHARYAGSTPARSTIFRTRNNRPRGPLSIPFSPAKSVYALHVTKAKSSSAVFARALLPFVGWAGKGHRSTFPYRPFQRPFGCIDRRDDDYRSGRRPRTVRASSISLAMRSHFARTAFLKFSRAIQRSMSIASARTFLRASTPYVRTNRSGSIEPCRNPDASDLVDRFAKCLATPPTNFSVRLSALRV